MNWHKSYIALTNNDNELIMPLLVFVKNGEMMEVGASMVRMGWRPAGLSAHLPLLSSPSLIKSTTRFRCEWVNVSSSTGPPGLSETKGRTTAVYV